MRLLCYLTTVPILILSACGGGGEGGSAGGSSMCNEPAPRSFTSAQISVMTASDVAGLTDDELAGMGTNLRFMTNAGLSGIRITVSNLNPLCHHDPQITAITAEQIAALKPEQVRWIGAGASGVAQIEGLSDAAWAQLVKSPEQVTAITPEEMKTLSSTKIGQIGANFHFLADAALRVMKETFISTIVNRMSQITAISPDEFVGLTPAQVRNIGAAETGVAKLFALSESTWKRLVADPVHVAALTAGEIPTLTTNQFTGLDLNLRYLSLEALRAVKPVFTPNLENPSSQSASISVAQLATLDAQQVLALASGPRLEHFAAATFATLSPVQVSLITAPLVSGITPQYLASLDAATLAAFPAATRGAFTMAQTSLFSTAQHSACGC